MKLLLLSLLLPLLLISCGDDTVDPPAGSGAIMPLAVGNIWVGNWTRYDSTGAVSSTRLDTVHLVSTVTDSGQTWYRDNDDLWFRIDPARGLVGTHNILLAKYPAQPGDTFETEEVMVLVDTTSGPIVGVVGWKVVSTDTSITVPAGTFRCHHYREQLLSPSSASLLRTLSYFYAPGVGPVLKEQWQNTGSPPLPADRWELVSYRLN